MNSGIAFLKSGAGAALIGVSGLLCAPAIAAGVDAGTLIENQAQATFETPAGAQAVLSNTVTLRVEEVLDAALASLDPGPVNATQVDVVLSFSLTNTGNGPEVFTLIANPAVAGNDFDLTVTGIAIDTNDNGVYDDGIDLLLSTPEVTPELVADAASTVFVLASAPGGTPDGSRSALELQANAVTSSGTPGDIVAGAGQDGTDAIVGAGGAQAFAQGEVVIGSQSVTLTKSAVVQDQFGGASPISGAIISYSIFAAVEGSAAVMNLTITDPIPTGTSYVPGSLLLDGARLTDASGDDAGEVTAGGVSIALGTVPAGTSSIIEFDVRIEE